MEWPTPRPITRTIDSLGTSGQLASIPPISRWLAGIVAGVAFVRLLVPSMTHHYLSLVPGYTVGHMYVWNVFTCGFYELSLLAAGVSVAGIMLFGRYLEPLWGTEEFLRFTLVVNVSAALATFILSIFLYALLQAESLLFGGYGGFSAALAGYAVAMKQLHPDSELLALYLPVRAKHLPVLLLAVSFLAPVVFGSLQPFALFGTLFSWIYLRFFQKKGSTVGDHSAEFAFSTLFPESLQGFVVPVESALGKITTLLKCCPSAREASTSSLYQLEEGALPLGPQEPQPQVSSFDSERRRALALHAIDERLAQKEGRSVPDDSSPGDHATGNAGPE